MRLLTSATLALMLASGGLATLAPATSQAQFAVNVRVNLAPPELPDYDQPPCPGYGYIWTPGYWAWGDYDQDYYWVPGTWILPPQTGYLWTPGYWAFYDGAYLFTSGYWGLTVGFYGGIDYGYGYGGYGYDGGYWRGRDFFYNRRVNNLRDGRFGNVYDREVHRFQDHDRMSFNGGPNGVRARPSDQDRARFGERHLAPTGDQMRHFQLARSDPSLRAGVNHGAPPIAATPRPGELRAPGVRPARGGSSYERDIGGSGGPVYAPRPDQGPPDGGYRPGPTSDQRRRGPSPLGYQGVAPLEQAPQRPSFRGQERPGGDFFASPQRQAAPPLVSRSVLPPAPPSAPYLPPGEPRSMAHPNQPVVAARPDRAPPPPAAAQQRPAPRQDRDNGGPRGDRTDHP